MADRPLNATAAALLGFLHEGPMTGWDLAGTAAARIGKFWTVTQSQVYRELSNMTKAGLVRPGQPGPRERKPYTITSTGRRTFAAWLDQEPGQEQIRFPLLLTIMFAGHLPPQRLGELVAEQRALHADRLAGYRQQRAEISQHASEVDAFRLATLEFGIRHETAVLEWFAVLPDLLPGIDPR